MNDFICCYCGCDSFETPLMSMDAPCACYICKNCIEKKGKETGKVGIFSYARGLKFYTKEEAKKLCT